MTPTNPVRSTDRPNYVIRTAVLVSCIIHGILIALIDYMFGDTLHTYPSPTEIRRFSLQTFQSQDTKDSDNKMTPANPVKPSPQKTLKSKYKIPRDPADSKKIRGISIPQKLDLRYDPNALYEEIFTKPLKYGGITSNGATIMNGELFELIKNAQSTRASKKSFPRGTPLYGDLSLTGMSTYTKIDGKCFMVSEPKPFDPASLETWTRVRCR